MANDKDSYSGGKSAREPNDEINTRAATYMNPTYQDTFNNRMYSAAGIGEVRRKLREKYDDRMGMKWGYYQQELVPDKNDWGGADAFDNWIDFMQEARDDLEKQPAQFNDPKNAMDPFDTTKVAVNLMEHLDEAVRIAIYDRGVPVSIRVDRRSSRHHGFTTEWVPAPPAGINPGYVPTRLVLHMRCPQGGWQGFALFRNRDSTRPITRLTSTWEVPQAPRNSTGQQIVFIFNGLESVSRRNRPGAILQPVLQWTNAGWFIRSWYVSSEFDPASFPTLPDPSREQLDLSREKRVYTRAVPVSTGNRIKGIINGGMDAGGKFDYRCGIELNGTRVPETDLRRNDVPELTWAVCAVESYNVTTPADDYPGPITMTGINLHLDHSEQTPIDWKPNKLGYDFSTIVVNDGRKIVFRR